MSVALTSWPCMVWTLSFRYISASMLYHVSLLVVVSQSVVLPQKLTTLLAVAENILRRHSQTSSVLYKAFPTISKLWTTKILIRASRQTEYNTYVLVIVDTWEENSLRNSYITQIHCIYNFNTHTCMPVWGGWRWEGLGSNHRDQRTSSLGKCSPATLVEMTVVLIYYILSGTFCGLGKSASSISRIRELRARVMTHMRLAFCQGRTNEFCRIHRF